MTEPTKSLRDQIADLIDENAEVRGEHYNDHAILTNADELAASIVELLSLSAPSALENGKAGLADATNDPADLSSLRKGAEATCKQPLQVAIKLLEWRGSASDSPVGEYVVRKDFDAGDDAPWTLDLDGMAVGHLFDTLRLAKAAAQSDFETRIRSALVSGSREDGDG